MKSLMRWLRRKDLHHIDNRASCWRTIHEPYTGAWQRNDELKIGTGLCYPTLYACLNRISQDIGKLPFLLKAPQENGIWREIESAAYSPVLAAPNDYQTPQQFRESWILSKLMHGNTYVLLGRDSRGVVVRMHVLDPCRIMPMVSETGAVYYRVDYHSPNNLLPEDYPAETLTIPASEIVHDRMNCFHHPLVGVPPICAAYWPTVKNLKILKGAAEFFGNASQPGGILTGPAGMSEADALAVQKFWQENYSGESAGKIAVIGADLKFQSFAMKSADSQLVEQMRYSDEQICQPFGIPPYKIGIGSIPAGLGIDAINQLYYSDALQAHVQAMETLISEAMRVAPYRVDMDEMVLMRMDSSKKAAYHTALIQGSVETSNEARRDFGLAPLEGGDTIYMQQQDYPLDQVRLNKIQDAARAPDAASEDAAEDDDQEETRQLLASISYKAAMQAVQKETQCLIR